MERNAPVAYANRYILQRKNTFQSYAKGKAIGYGAEMEVPDFGQSREAQALPGSRVPSAVTICDAIVGWLSARPDFMRTAQSSGVEGTHRNYPGEHQPVWFLAFHDSKAPSPLGLTEL